MSEILCPKCNSSLVIVSENGDIVILTCLDCGQESKADQDATSINDIKNKKKLVKLVEIGCAVLILIVIILAIIM
jgi:DNA-directed RNA polymerase subunit M/transcription elongation factor TFIIS